MIKITDLHNDYLTFYGADDVIKEYAFSPHDVVGTVFRGGKDFSYAKNKCRTFLKGRRDGLYLAFEDFGYNEDLEILFSGLLDRNPVYVGLTWNGENNLAYGAGSSGGVKERGKRVIKELNFRNIPVDVAHLSEKSFCDVIDLADKVLCSHACFFAVNAHLRNLKREQVKLIIEKGGVFGLTLYSSFLRSGKVATVDDVYAHIDCFSQTFGCDNLCFGTDFYGCEDLPTGFETYAFGEILTDYLLKKGYKLADIDKILWKNGETYLKAVQNGIKKPNYTFWDFFT